MASVPVETTRSATTGELLFANVRDHGTASHPYFVSGSLTAGAEHNRNLADALHFFSALHGRYPGVMDHAAGRSHDKVSRSWLNAACEAMSVERQFLARLAVAAGPAPSTPGSGSQAALLAQRTALTVLAQSERHGCALGAALALAVDWITVRALLETAAARLGLVVPDCTLGDEANLNEVADAAGASLATERAMLFGAQQLALQHRSLWDLLDARHQARLDY